MDIKTSLKKRGITLKDVAAKMRAKDGSLGISIGALSQIVNGNPTLSKVQEIADIAECSVPDLLTGDDTDFIAFVRCKGKFYHAVTLDELKSLVSSLEEQRFSQAPQ